MLFDENCRFISNFYIPNAGNITSISLGDHIIHYDLKPLPSLEEENFIDKESVRYLKSKSGIPLIAMGLDPAIESPESISEILLDEPCVVVARNAFQNQGAIKKANLNRNLLSICDNAFSRCGLEEFSAPSSLRILNGLSDNPIASITLHDGLRYIGANCFTASTFESLSIPEGVIDIGGMLFFGNQHIKSVTFPSSLISMQENALGRCNSLENVTFASSDTYIDGELLSYSEIDYTKLKEFDNAYYFSSGENPYFALVSVKDKELDACQIHEDCEMILPNAFYQSKIKDIVIPKKVLNIGYRAFYELKEVSSITFMGETRYIGMEAFFSYSENIEIVSIPGSIGNMVYKSFYLMGCKEVRFLEGLRSINGIFAGTYPSEWPLQSIYLPHSLMRIGKNAFRDGKKLKDIHFNGSKEEWEAISIDESAFLDVSATIHCLDDEIVLE